MTDDISFGQLVRKHRSMLGLTREELATRVGCSTVTIRKIESGERRPSRPMAQLLTDHLVRGRSERAAFLAAARYLSELPLGQVLVCSSSNIFPLSPFIEPADILGSSM